MMYYTCNGSPTGCERERFGMCDYHDQLKPALKIAEVEMEYSASALRLLNSHTLSQRERNAAINRAVELANHRRLAYVTFSCMADALRDVAIMGCGSWPRKHRSRNNRG